MGYSSSRGLFFTSFNLLLVLGTLVGQIFASPLPLSADTAMLQYKRNSSSDISSSNFESSLFNWEHSDFEVAPLNGRGLTNLFSKSKSDKLLLGIGFVDLVSC